MPGKEAHKKIQKKVAGKTGRIEVRLPSGRRLDVATKARAIEIEKGGSLGSLHRAAERLRESKKPQKVLIVPQKDMVKGRKAMRDIGVAGTVKNISGTKSSYIGAKKSTPTHKPSRPSKKK